MKHQGNPEASEPESAMNPKYETITTMEPEPGEDPESLPTTGTDTPAIEPDVSNIVLWFTEEYLSEGLADMEV